MSIIEYAGGHEYNGVSSVNIECYSKATLPLHTRTDNVTYSIRFRPLKESDRDQIKRLNEEIFPVAYTENFYDTVVMNLSMDKMPLFSCIASANKDDEECSYHDTYNNHTPKAWERLANHVRVPMFNLGGLNDTWLLEKSATVNHLASSSNQIIQGETIVGCVVGTFVDVSRVPKETTEKLVYNPIKHKQMFYIMTLGSSETFRGQGLGTKLMRECMNIVEQVQDCGIIYLHVITYNQTAIRFYERLGFYRIEEIPNYYSIDDKNYNCYLYAKYINGMEFNCHDSVSFLI